MDGDWRDVRARTLRRVIAKGYANDLGFSVGGRLICLAEAQSYPMGAMRLRTLFHLAATFQDYLSENGMSVYDVGGVLKGYIDVCGVIDSKMTGNADCGRDAVLEAFEACKSCGTVGEFVWSRRYEIMGVYEQMFDEEENLRMNCASPGTRRAASSPGRPRARHRDRPRRSRGPAAAGNLPAGEARRVCGKVRQGREQKEGVVRG